MFASAYEWTAGGRTERSSVFLSVCGQELKDDRGQTENHIVSAGVELNTKQARQIGSPGWDRGREALSGA